VAFVGGVFGPLFSLAGDARSSEELARGALGLIFYCTSAVAVPGRRCGGRR